MSRRIGSTPFVIKHIEAGYRQINEQSKGWFYLSLIAAIIGLVLVSVGSRDIIGLAGIIANAIAALFFAQSKAANKRVDSIQLQLADVCKLWICIEIIDSIVDPVLRDKLRAEAVRNILAVGGRKIIQNNRRRK